ncbi:hypothetical protein J6590_015209 [Homalodisca vitripennis]|nr:hypothetical protein J6590_015209 [Homalodisca vitripennis]
MALLLYKLYHVSSTVGNIVPELTNDGADSVGLHSTSWVWWIYCAPNTQAQMGELNQVKAFSPGYHFLVGKLAWTAYVYALLLHKASQNCQWLA